MKILIAILLVTWSQIVLGQSEPITSLQGQSGTKFTSPKLVTPFNQATKTSLGGLIETGNLNMLVNPEFEAATTLGWTCTVGTCTVTSTAGEFSSGRQALKVALSAQAMNVSQTVNTTSGIQKQGYARVTYRVPSTMADFQICTLVDAVEQSCVPSANLVLNDNFRSIEIPLVFGSTSAGIKFKTTSSYTANAFFDSTIVAQGLGTQNLMTDNTYSAQVSSTGIVSGENTNWINGNCSVSDTSLYRCNLNTNLVTVAMTCVSSVATGAFSTDATIADSTSTYVDIRTGFASDNIGNLGKEARAFRLICQKSGNDYLNSSANVYSQNSANYSRRSYTPTFTGFGTVSSVDCYESREGEFLNIDCRFTSGTSTGVEARVSLPSSLTTPSNMQTLSVRGVYQRNITNAETILVTAEPSIGYVTFSRQDAGEAGLAKDLGTTVAASGQIISFIARIPITSWSNSSAIIGSFAGVPAVPSYQGKVDTFSVSFAANSSFNSACTTGTCTIDQVGSNEVTSISFTGTGAYSMVTARTYAELYCTGSALGATYVNIGSIRVTNTNTFPFFTGTGSTATNVYGTLDCKGSY